MVIFTAVLPQLIWEYQNHRIWLAGDFMCRFVKFNQSFSLMASTNMVVAIALDRHQAITTPLQSPVAVRKLAGTAWFIAACTSLPMVYVFHVVGRGIPKCENIFRGKPKVHRQAFLTYATAVVFIIPLVIIFLSYYRLFKTISRKAGQNLDRHQYLSKVRLNRVSTGSLSRAKTKTFLMTCVIVFVYVVCGIPYFVAEMILSYGSPCVFSGLAYGIMGGLAAANSAANPYVFLLFNVKVTDTRGDYGQSIPRTMIRNSQSTSRQCDITVV